jgi:glycosyltransferase involved in cell wall biosynthesis
VRAASEKLEKLSGHLVSVIIPAFNAANHIRQTLISVLGQTHQTLEVIVVDDGSTDATAAIVEQFVKKDARIQLIRQSNSGVGAARNMAIGKAHGKYIAPLDADDVWSPKKLENQVARMEQCDNETGLVYCGTTLIDEYGNFLRALSLQTVEGRLRRALILSNFIGNASVPLFRATALEKVGVYLTRAEQGGAQGCEDWDLNLRIAEHFRIRVVPEHLLAYRLSRSSMSVDAESMAASFDVVFRRARERNSDVPPAIFNWSAGDFYAYLVGKCDFGGHYQLGFRYLKKQVFANPFYLLKTSTYKQFIKMLLTAISGSTWKKFFKQVQPWSWNQRHGADLDSNKKRRRPFISNRIFESIADRHWSAALNDRD